MGVTDVMLGKVRSVSSVPNGQADSCSGSCSESMHDAIQGRDTSVRGKIAKGLIVQGAQHPRTFGRGHIGRGHINPASSDVQAETVDGASSTATPRKSIKSGNMKS